MRQLRPAGQGPGPLVLALCGVALALCVSCETLTGTPAESGSRKSAAEPLPLGSWKTGQLHCAAGRCERWYELHVEEDGVLKVDLYAPVGSALPDCEMRLETPEGDALPARTGRVRTQRRLRHTVEPTTYYLHVVSAGSKDRFDYDVFAQVSQEAAGAPTRPAKPAVPTDRAPDAVPQTRPQPRPQIPMAKMPADDDEPEPDLEELDAIGEPDQAVVPDLPADTPTPAPRWIRSEVLDIEESGGEPSAVMIEAGVPEGVQEGMQGELINGETVIGRIEIVDVYKSGSRARIVGPLSAPVSFDTVSRIPVPPEIPQNGK